MACDTVADAMEGIARQVPGWDRNLRIAVVGFDDERALTTPTDQEVVHVMPALAGGGGRFGSIILGAVTFAVGTVLTFTGIAPQVGISLMISGGLMMVQGVIGLFMKAPDLSRNETEASKYLAVNRNTIAVGTPIVMAWGTIDLAGHWLSLQSDSSNLAHGVFPATP